MGDAVLYAAALAAPIGFGVALRVLARRDARAPSRTLHVLIANVLVLGLLLSLLFLALETWYRFGAQDSDLLNVTRVSKWFDRHFRANNIGMRDDVDYGHGALRLAPQPGVRRIVFVGDSVTAGHGVADVSDRFANRVRHALGPRFEVHVLARPGFETAAESDLLQQLDEIGYRFDVLVLMYFGNDVGDLVPDWYAAVQRFSATPEPAWVRHSFLLDLWFWRLLARDQAEVGRYHELMLTGYRGETWARQRERLLWFRDFCRERQVRLLVVTFPFLERLGPGDPFGDVYEQLGRFWDEAGVPNLDLRHAFRDRDPADLVVSRWDAHPNEEAHRIAAEAILSFLGAPADARPQRDPR